MTNDPKRNGRPPLDPRTGGTSPELHLRLPAVVFERAEKAAAARRESVQDLIRRELSRVLRDEHG